MSSHRDNPGTSVKGAYQLLAGLSPEQAQRVVDLGEVISLGPETQFITLGERAKNLYLIRSGRIALSKPISLRGEERDILLEEKDPGNTVGWSAFVPPYLFTLNARAVVDTELIVISGAALRELSHHDPQIGAKVSSNVAEMIGRRLLTVQTMWVRAMQRSLETLEKSA